MFAINPCFGILHLEVLGSRNATPDYVHETCTMKKRGYTGWQVHPQLWIAILCLLHGKVAAQSSICYRQNYSFQSLSSVCVLDINMDCAILVWVLSYQN